jgi:hypothetical protein
LLETMHDHGNRDSLVYWLELKNDDEMPAIFGSIAGGSALKFGLYRRKETGAWMTGSPQKQQELTVEEAVEMARKHRDQLIRGTKLLEKLPANGTDADYQALQEQMDSLAPDVSRAAWGHKYFSPLNWETLERLHRKMDRLTRAYAPAIAIIEVLLESAGIALDGAWPTRLKLPGFLFDWFPSPAADKTNESGRPSPTTWLLARAEFGLNGHTL